MDKVLTIPDNQVDALKIKAIKSKMSFKQYLEYLIQLGIKSEKLQKETTKS